MLGADLDADRNIRAAGSDFAAGARVDAPRRLGPADLALLAAMNAGRVAVARRPVVALIPTGDELVVPGEDPGPDQIVSSNGIGIAGAPRSRRRGRAPPPHRPRHRREPRRRLRARRGNRPRRHDRRRLGRRPRPRAADRPRPRHGPRLPPGGHAPGKAADGGPPRPHAARRPARQPGLGHGDGADLPRPRRGADARPARPPSRHAPRPGWPSPSARTARAPTTCAPGPSPPPPAGSAPPPRARTARFSPSSPKPTPCCSARRTIRRGRPATRLNLSGFNQPQVVLAIDS